MKSNTKNRIQVMVMGAVLLIGLLFIGYIVFGKPIAGVEYTPMLKIIAADNVEEIDKCKKYDTPYAHKIKEGDDYFLEYPNAEKYKLTEKQYDELIESNYYCFKIKFSKISNTSNGTVKSIYTENPVQR